MTTILEQKSRAQVLIGALVAGGLVVFGLGAVLLAQVLSRPLLPAPTQTVEVLRATPDVLTAVQDLARIETTRFHIERVIDLRDRHQWLFGMLEGEDSILLVAAGDVVAGIDLARLRPEDVQVDTERRRVRIVLPAPEVLSSALDVERTFVFSRETDLLARRSSGLETRARRAAEESIRNAALESGILVRAGNGARDTVGTLVRALGYEDVEIRLSTDEL
ncbi:MAG: DUF4230 domain-containing protein [Polyangiaceae bacterium]|nr:DUF4230 domain-containing protein [Polyangiaceae bacterium]